MCMSKKNKKSTSASSEAQSSVNLSSVTLPSVTLYVAAWPVEKSVGPIYDSQLAKNQKTLSKTSKAPSAVKGEAIKREAMLLSFSAPDYGIMFRCRVVCPADDGVATAAVTGLRFLEVTLQEISFEKVTLCIDSPAYYFQATGQTADTTGAREKMLKRYHEKYKLDFKLIDRVNNPARYNCHGLPTTPEDIKPPLVYNPLKWPQNGKMMSLQNGIKL